MRVERMPVYSWHASKQHKWSSLISVSVQVDGFKPTSSFAVDASTHCICVEGDGSCITYLIQTSNIYLIINTY